MAAAFAQIEAEGGLDVLVNNAGIAMRWSRAGGEALDGPSALQVFDTNAVGIIRVTQAALPLLRRSDNPVVVNVSSALGSFWATHEPSRPAFGYPAIVYGSSKTAVSMLTVQYAKAVPEVKFNAVEPGITATALGGGDPGSPPRPSGRGQRPGRRTPGDHRHGRPDRHVPGRRRRTRMVTRDPGTILIAGPAGGLGRETTLATARRPASQRPDLLLVGRAGPRLTQVADQARSAGATVHEIRCDLANLADVRAAATTAQDLLATGAVRPLHGMIANAGVSVRDTHGVSKDGYERTFAINYLAHAQLIAELLTSFTAPARIVLLGSNTYYANRFRKLLGVAAADWRDPIELAQPTPTDARTSMKTSGTAYSNSKLAILYYAHELQRRAPNGVSVMVFEPGFMPGTGLGREYGAAAQHVSRAIGHLPGVSRPRTSGRALASVVLDERWAHLRDGAFVLIDKEQKVQPFANDRDREARLGRRQPTFSNKQHKPASKPVHWRCRGWTTAPGPGLTRYARTTSS